MTDLGKHHLEALGELMDWVWSPVVTKTIGWKVDGEFHNSWSKWTTPESRVINLKSTKTESWDASGSTHSTTADAVLQKTKPESEQASRCTYHVTENAEDRWACYVPHWTSLHDAAGWIQGAGESLQQMTQFLWKIHSHEKGDGKQLQIKRKLRDTPTRGSGWPCLILIWIKQL